MGSSDRIFKSIVRNRIIRYIFNLKFQDSCRPIFNLNKIHTAPVTFILKCIELARQNLNISAWDFWNWPLYKATQCWAQYWESLSTPIKNLHNIIPYYFITIKCHQRGRNDNMCQNNFKSLLVNECYYSCRFLIKLNFI